LYSMYTEQKLLPTHVINTIGKKKVPDIARPKVLNRIDRIRIKLLSLGFTEEPLAELEDIALHNNHKSQRARAAQTIALWYLRVNTLDSCMTALRYIQLAEKDAGPTIRAQLTVAQMLCYTRLNYRKAANKLFEKLEKNSQITADLWLTWTNFQDEGKDRLFCINKALAIHGVPPVSLVPQKDALPPYDRLQAAEPTIPVHNGPKVTVFVAAYNCPETIPTCLRALEQQSWKNLEVIVIDDHSPTSETLEIARKWAHRDPRFTAIRMPENGGAYIARN